MKAAIKKIFAKKEYYDDILGMVVTENKFRIWALRIVFLMIPILVALLFIRNFF
ncbi:MAG TPA: hypothetical protein VKD08_05030 [Ignavibacteriaceae bacterium]|nr:hypothetical protein [Ignavibacteriaceae bacterium]